MASFNVTRFYGMIPRLGDDMLPEGEQVNAATLAINTRVKSGHLVPYKDTVPVESFSFVLETFIRVNVANSPEPSVWFSWDTDTDLVTGTLSDTRFAFNGDFFYYTTEGTYPRMTYGDYALGLQPAQAGVRYPRSTFVRGNQTENAQFALGIPKPDARPTAEVVPYEPKTTAGYERDSSNLVTITTQNPHELKTGNVVSITGFGDRRVTQPIVVPPIVLPQDPEQPEQPN